MADSCDKHALDEKQQHPSAEVEQSPSNSGDQPVSRRQALSPYFTIAAAAFGLISDGCGLSQIQIFYSLQTKSSRSK